MNHRPCSGHVNKRMAMHPPKLLNKWLNISAMLLDCLFRRFYAVDITSDNFKYVSAYIDRLISHWTRVINLYLHMRFLLLCFDCWTRVRVRWVEEEPRRVRENCIGQSGVEGGAIHVSARRAGFYSKWYVSRMVQVIHHVCKSTCIIWSFLSTTPVHVCTFLSHLVCVCVCYKTIDEPYIATDSRTHLNTRTLECSCKFSLPSANVHFVLAFFVCVCAHFRIVIAFLETNFGCSHREYTVNLIDFRRKEHITKFKQCQFYRCVFFCQPPSRWHSSEKIRVKDTEFLSLLLFF